MINDRIRRARLLRGLSLQALAEQMDSISKQMLSKFEQGSAVPNSARLLELARVLSVKPEYFFRSDSVQLAPLEFRKRASVSQKRQDQIAEQLRDQLERYVSIEQCFDADGVALPLVPEHSISVTGLEDAERAAEEMRVRWNVGGDAIGHLVELLEDHGLKVALFDDDDDVDGVCVVTTDRSHALIALNGQRPGERQRFTAAHELGHWVMALTDAPDAKASENLCHRFAGAFLYPRERVLADFGAHQRGRVHAMELLNAKRRYGVSMGVALRRLKDLELITDAGYREMQIQFSMSGWRQAEPERMEVERPRRFETLVYRALAEELISSPRAAELLQLPMEQLNADLVPATV